MTQEVGLDMASLGAKNVGVYTDSTLVKYVSVTLFLMSAYSLCLDPCASACHQSSRPLTPSPNIKSHSPSMTRSPWAIPINCLLTTHSKVRVEPTDVSFREASDFAKAHSIDAFLAVGGGSVIDTAKAANLYSSDPDADLLDYVNAPIGGT